MEDSFINIGFIVDQNLKGMIYHDFTSHLPDSSLEVSTIPNSSTEPISAPCLFFSLSFLSSH